MLRFAPKGDASAPRFVTPEEDGLLRQAFGRYGGSFAARLDAIRVVARYQQHGSGMWLLCDCRPDAARPPALIPVAMTHIRRHDDARWPAHAETCDFFREPEEQLVITASFLRSRSRPFRLARRFTVWAQPMEGQFTACSQASRRPGLARLLAQLVTDAGLQTIAPGWRPPPLVDQVKAIWAAARSVEIDAGVPLTEFFCTNLTKLGAMIARIDGAPSERFKHTRPHGILIVRVRAVGEGVLEPMAGPPIPVLGRLAAFGESAEGPVARSRPVVRAPYLAACVLGPATLGGPVKALSAYAHPIAADAHLMLVDSDMERRTLGQLRSLQSWLARKKNTPVSIEKPLFDIGPDTGPEVQPRPPCIPDFVVRSGAATAIVETMGFADAGYRNRKVRVHAALTAALAEAPVVLHDFHEPPGRAQDWRDSRFWRELRGTLTGPEAVSAVAGAPQAAPPPLPGQPPRGGANPRQGQREANAALLCAGSD